MGNDTIGAIRPLTSICVGLFIDVGVFQSTVVD